MRRRPPKATRTDTTLSLHDALPICLAGLAGADAHGLTHVEDANLAVADRAGAGALLKRFDDPRGERIVADEFDLHLGHHVRSEEHTSELQSLMRTSSAVFCLYKHTTHISNTYEHFI